MGKTLQAIALASCYREEWPLLVVCPASLRLVWAEELEKWLPQLRPARIHVIEGREQRIFRDTQPLVTVGAGMCCNSSSTARGSVQRRSMSPALAPA